ncbi:MAG TPA: hypothetical protein VGJ34_01865 [Gaiellaceae bacterium]|jgi:REP element-mobilizing transposase RayT
MPGPRRNSPRLRDYDYATTGAYFVTVCSRERRCMFGDVVRDEMQLNRLGHIVADCWSDISAHVLSVQLDAFVVMPNHLHGIVWLEGAGHAPPLPS